MSLDEFSSEIDSSEGSISSIGAGKEVSEKFKESVKKASAWIKRTQKDEKKAKKHDFLLSNFLVRIILDKKYDILLDSLFKSLDSSFSSSFILWIVSLIDIEISNKIRNLAWKQKINFNYLPKNESIDFHDYNIDSDIKNRINLWVEDIISILSIEYSSLLTTNLINTTIEKRDIILNFSSLVFIFFFDGININITKSKSDSYCDFIISEIINSLKNLQIEEI